MFVFSLAFPLSVLVAQDQLAVLVRSPGNLDGGVQLIQTQDERSSVPAFESEYSYPNGTALINITDAQRGLQFLFSGPDGDKPFLVIVQSDRDVIAPSVNADLRVRLGERIIWSGANSLMRLSDASGNVLPASDVRYTIAFGEGDAGVPAAFNAVLRGRLSNFATPQFASSGVFFFRDLLGSALVRVTVLDASGNEPTVAPFDPPAFERYFETSPQAVTCDCRFGSQTGELDVPCN